MNTPTPPIEVTARPTRDTQNLPGLNEHLTKAAEAELADKAWKIADAVKDAVRKETGLYLNHIAVENLRIGGAQVGLPTTQVNVEELIEALRKTIVTGAKEQYVTAYKERFLTRLAELEKQLAAAQEELENIRGGQG